MRSALEDIEDFLDRCTEVFCDYVPEGLGPCFRPMLAPSKSGYVYLQRGGKKVQATRAVCFLVNGWFDPKLQVLHKCDNEWCVAPKHLRPGTKRENALQREARKRRETGGVQKPTGTDGQPGAH